MIYHIYWGTSGNSGLYLDEIYQRLKDAGYDQKVFVSYYYPFDYGEKIFFRRSDMAHCKLKGIKRRWVQLYELATAFLSILLSARKDKPNIVNYSLISGSYGFMVYFLKMIKSLSGCKLVVTCHDVCPWGNHAENSREMVNRQRTVDLADFLLAHNDSSVSDLQHVFHIDKAKIVKHLFPIMDLTKLQNIQSVEKQCDFLFIGHLRKDKGVDFLLETWKEFHEKEPNATLWLCGRSQGQEFDTNELKKQNVNCNLGYISEKDYCRYIQSARYVVLPYLKGTNSGIISTVLSLGANVITSDIPMFQDNPLVDKSNMFKSGDTEALTKILSKMYHYQNMNDNESALSDYQERFNEEVLSVYKTIGSGGTVC